MLEHTEIDILTRWYRMRGYNTLYLPGTDHAGISTKRVVVKHLMDQGIDYHKLGREEFEKQVWKWKAEAGSQITQQMRAIGESCDWSREKFTLSPEMSRVVREVFVRLYEERLIYRDNRLVNWCPVCLTVLSDLEVVHEERQGHLWHIKYPVAGTKEFLVVATTRPETMLGDTAVAVNPKDERYAHFVGKKALLPLMDREIPIIADEMVDRKFGTGAVKITPAHDPNDFEVGRRHKLAEIDVMTDDGKMNAAAGVYAGMDRFEARKKIVEDLKALGLLENITEHTNAIGLCERSNTIVEPRASTQLFCTMKPLAEPAIAVVERGEIQIVPDNRRQEYLNWMHNIRDWTLSRQLWWGHRIPAWYCKENKHITVAREIPAKCTTCGSTNLEQDSDVLDTWFSSGLWPFSTLGWPENTADFKTYYPTTLLITGYDILFFWVAWMAAPGTDIVLSEDKLASARNFTNKIWNAARFLFVNLEKFEQAGGKIEDVALPEVRDNASYQSGDGIELVDLWIFSRLGKAIVQNNEALANYRFHEAAQSVYHFFWGDFCDWYIEWVKPRLLDKNLARATAAWRNLFAVFERALRLLHPFMPFLTEELWKKLPQRAGIRSIALDSFPEARSNRIDPVAEKKFLLLQRVITSARTARADNKLDPKKRIAAELSSQDVAVRELVKGNLEPIQRLAVLSSLLVTSNNLTGKGYFHNTPEFDVHIPFAEIVNPQAEMARLKKDREGLQKAIASKEAQLGNEMFRSRAPDMIIKGLEATLAEQRIELKKLQDRLAQLK